MPSFAGEWTLKEQVGYEDFMKLMGEYQQAYIENKISNLHYTRVIMTKRVTSGGTLLRGSAPGQHSCEETSKR